MRIAIGGIMHESNTFAPLPTDRGRFEQGSLTRGDAMLATWREAHHEVGGFIAGADRVWLRAGPDGDGLGHARRAGHGRRARRGRRRRSSPGRGERPSDGLLLALHGAMVSGGYPEADAEVLRRLRAAARRGPCRSSRPWISTRTSRRPWRSTPMPWSGIRPTRTPISAESASRPRG